MVDPPPKPVKEDRSTRAFCPNCGIPKSAYLTLDRLLKKKKKVRFICRACGFKCILSLPSKKKKDEEEKEFDMKDAVKVAKDAKTIIGLVKGIG